MIALHDCVVRGVYRVTARNVTIGVFCGNGAFVGIRTKFGDRYLDVEYHRDYSTRHGTVRPLVCLAMLPAEIAIEDWAPGCWEPALFDYLDALLPTTDPLI